MQFIHLIQGCSHETVVGTYQNQDKMGIMRSMKSTLPEPQPTKTQQYLIVRDYLTVILRNEKLVMINMNDSLIRCIMLIFKEIKKP